MQVKCDHDRKPTLSFPDTQISFHFSIKIFYFLLSVGKCVFSQGFGGSKIVSRSTKSVCKIFSRSHLTTPWQQALECIGSPFCSLRLVGCGAGFLLLLYYITLRNSKILNNFLYVVINLLAPNLSCIHFTTVDLETLEPHIIASYTIIRRMSPTLLHTSMRNDQKVSVVYLQYLLSYSRKSVVLMFQNALQLIDQEEISSMY